MDRSTGQWALWMWAIGGVLAVLVNAVIRLSPRAAGVFDGSLSSGQIFLTIVWTGFMLYSEAWRGFHLAFSPRVVARAGRLIEAPSLWQVVLAPVIAMGLIHATPRRLLVSRLLLFGIVALVLLVRLLPEPWRAIVDFGVVVGLAGGAASLLWHAVQDIIGSGSMVDPEFPDSAVAGGRP